MTGDRIGQMGETVGAEERLQKLLSAHRAIVGELDLPRVLRRVVEAARDLAGAQFGALGVIGADGSLEQFVHVGLDRATVSAIGELPKGRGLLGALIQDPRPIRLPRITDDERSSGFPPNHPPMDSFLGVPIRSRNDVYGNLYLTRQSAVGFTGEDEDLVQALAATAGIAIENARLYEESRRRQLWLRASAEISAELVSTDGDGDLLELIVRTVLGLKEADVVTVVVPIPQTNELRVAVAAGAGEAELIGLVYPKVDTLVAMAMDSGRGVRVALVGDQPGYDVHLSRAVEVEAVMAVPLAGGGGPQGAIVVGRVRGRPNFTTADLEMAEAFASHAAVARELVGARAAQQKLAVLEERDRIARDLHDHVIQQLFATGLSVQSLAERGNETQGETVDRIVEDIDDTIRQVRTTIYQLRSTSPQPRLRAAVLRVAQQVAPLLGLSPSVWFRGPVDTVVPQTLMRDVEAVVREGLTNVAKHAGASEVIVDVTADGGRLRLDVADNGRGLGDNPHRSGLDNLRRRAQNLGGDLIIDQRHGEGTRLRWTIPLSS